MEELKVKKTISNIDTLILETFINAFFSIAKNEKELIFKGPLRPLKDVCIPENAVPKHLEAMSSSEVGL